MPSLLAEVLARAIRSQLLDDQPNNTELKLLPPSRRPIPAPEQVAQLPTKYRSYIGEHADHPGEGLGSGAARRRAEVSNEAAL